MRHSGLILASFLTILFSLYGVNSFAAPKECISGNTCHFNNSTATCSSGSTCYGINSNLNCDSGASCYNIGTGGITTSSGATGNNIAIEEFGKKIKWISPTEIRVNQEN